MSYVKIKSDGIPGGTTITSSDRELRVAAADIRMRSDEMNTATMEVQLADIEIEAEARWVVTDPRDGQIKGVKAIAFDDGTVWRSDQ